MQDAGKISGGPSLPPTRGKKGGAAEGYLQPQSFLYSRRGQFTALLGAFGLRIKQEEP